MWSVAVYVSLLNQILNVLVIICSYCTCNVRMNRLGSTYYLLFHTYSGCTVLFRFRHSVMRYGFRAPSSVFPVIAGFTGLLRYVLQYFRFVGSILLYILRFWRLGNERPTALRHRRISSLPAGSEWDLSLVTENSQVNLGMGLRSLYLPVNLDLTGSQRIR